MSVRVYTCMHVRIHTYTAKPRNACIVYMHSLHIESNAYTHTIIQTITYIHFNDPPFLHLEKMIRSTMPKNQGLTAFLSNDSSVWLSRFSKRNPHIRKTSLCYQGDFAQESWCHPSFMQTKKATFQPSVLMPKT